MALSRVEASAMPRVLPFCNALRSDSSCYWRFAGIPATVVSGSVGELLVLVPAGAVTGPISVTVGSQSVASSTDFVVDQNAQQPRIDAIAPDVVNAGATVTVTGGSLYPILYQTTARIGASGCAWWWGCIR